MCNLRLIYRKIDEENITWALYQMYKTKHKSLDKYWNSKFYKIAEKTKENNPKLTVAEKRIVAEALQDEDFILGQQRICKNKILDMSLSLKRSASVIEGKNKKKSR